MAFKVRLARPSPGKGHDPTWFRTVGALALSGSPKIAASGSQACHGGGANLIQVVVVLRVSQSVAWVTRRARDSLDS